MKQLKLMIAIVLISGIGLSACHTSKRAKNSYMTMLYKELKKGVGEAKVRRDGDTVRVIYPELSMFDFNKDQIKAEAMPSFQRFAGILKNYDRVNFLINGYTDNVGTDAVNLSLSERRAENTKTLMQTDGIISSRMTTNGMGSANPIMTNTTDDGRQANRRVEFLLYENKTK